MVHAAEEQGNYAASGKNKVDDQEGACKTGREGQPYDKPSGHGETLQQEEEWKDEEVLEHIDLQGMAAQVFKEPARKKPRTYGAGREHEKDARDRRREPQKRYAPVCFGEEGGGKDA
jgi:hypothetical protein